MRLSIIALAAVGFIAARVSADKPHVGVKFRGWEQSGCQGKENGGDDVKIEDGHCYTFKHGFASFEYEKDKWNRVSHHDDDYDNGACRVYLFTQPDCAGYGSSPGSFIETYGQCGEMNTMPVPGRSVAVSCEGKDVVAWEQEGHGH